MSTLTQPYTKHFYCNNLHLSKILKKEILRTCDGKVATDSGDGMIGTVSAKSSNRRATSVSSWSSGGGSASEPFTAGVDGGAFGIGTVLSAGSDVTLHTGTGLAWPGDCCCGLLTPTAANSAGAIGCAALKFYCRDITACWCTATLCLAPCC